MEIEETVKDQRLDRYRQFFSKRLGRKVTSTEAQLMRNDLVGYCQLIEQIKLRVRRESECK